MAYLTKQQILFLRPKMLLSLAKEFTYPQLARMCGVSRNTIYKRIKEYKVKAMNIKK